MVHLKLANIKKKNNIISNNRRKIKTVCYTKLDCKYCFKASGDMLKMSTSEKNLL